MSTHSIRLARLALAGLISLVSIDAFAEPAGVPSVPIVPGALQPGAIPDAGSIMRIMPKEEVRPTPGPTLQIEEPIQLQAPKGFKVKLTGWKITGASQLPESELQPLIKDYIGREVGLDDLRQAARTLAAHFREQGYFVRAYLPEQEIKDGVVEIRIVEGRLGDVKVEDPAGVISPERSKRTITNAQPVGKPLELKNLERGILLLHDLPGVDATPTLKPGTRPGESDLLLKIDSRPKVNASLDFSNAGIRAVGQHVYGGTVAVNNPFRIGDQFTLLVQGGSYNVFGRFGYSLPVGYSGLRVGFTASSLYYALGNQFQALNQSGDAWTGGTYASYPVVRGTRLNLYALAGFDTRRFINRADPPFDSYLHFNNTLNTGYVGFNTDYRDNLLSSLGNGYTNFSFTTVIGDVDLTGTPQNLKNDALTARTNGGYQKFTFNLSRLQELPAKFSVWTRFMGQMATRNLNSAEKFSLGGPNGVRAYPVNEALSDEGYLMNFEIRYFVYENVQVVGFIDHGGVTVHNNPWPGSSGPFSGPNHFTLSGGGVGLNWIVPDNFAVRLSIAQRFGDNPFQNALNPYPQDNDGTRNTPQFWAQLSKSFSGF